MFGQVLRTEATLITTAKFTNILYCPLTKSQGTLAFHSSFPHQDNFSKTIKKKAQNVDKKEVLQAHVVQVEILQNELESLRAQLVNLKGKSSQLVNHAQHVQSSRSRDGPPRSFYAFSHNAMVGGSMFYPMHTILVSHQNLPVFFSFLLWGTRG